MKAFRWSVAAIAIFGGLALIAISLFTLLALSNLIEPGQEDAAVYWLIALPCVLGTGAWLLLVAWCYVDAERRGMNGPLWAILVFVLGFPVGPLLYLVLRKNLLPEPTSQI